MRIAMVLTSFSQSGGLELYAHKLVEGLLQRGHSVCVICEKKESPYCHEKLEVVQYAQAPPRSKKWQRILHAYEHASKAVEANGPFDIVHSQHLAIKKADAVTFHNHTASRLSRVGQGWERLLNNWKLQTAKAYQLRDQFDKELCYNSRCLIFPARVCLDDFRSTYEVDKHNAAVSYAVAHPGAQMGQPANNETAPLKQSSKSEQPFTFLFVGKGFRKKGLDILLLACARLRQEGQSFRLLIAGLRAKPLDRLRLITLGLQSHVHYLGFCKDMNSVYSQAEAIILPSRIEPFGMAPVQGMLKGLVPIVSQVSGVAEVLTDNEDALILKNHLDAKELAELMKKLMDDRLLTASLARQALVTASELTWERTVDSTLAAYNNLLANLKS
jgi:glycosyltransferase involved in cell wall biosynthesis